MSTAEDFKALGNAALKSQNYSNAIENYTKAINLDGTNHVFYSNRSAAYLMKKDAVNALKDADSCIGLNPNFAKGYSRKGAALHTLKRYNDSIEAYEDGLELFPQDKGLVSGLDLVKKEKEGPSPRTFGGGGGGGYGGFGGGGGGGGMPSLFGPDLMAKIALDPKLRTYMSDPDFMTKLNKLQTDPNSLGQMLGDPRIMEVFQLILGQQGMSMKTGDEFRKEQEDKDDDDDDDDDDDEQKMMSAAGDDSSSKPEPMQVDPTPTSTTTTSKQSTSTSTTEPDLSQQSEEVKAAVNAKERGNKLYKAKKFEEAITAYDEAIALDPTNMTFVSNKAAVYFTMKEYQTCIDTCLEAVEVGKTNRAPFTDRAKAMTRAAKAYYKMGDLANAIEMCNKSQLESYERDTQRLLKTYELEKKKSDKLAYQDDDKAEEAKQEGNTHFRNKEFGKAVGCYEEAVKRSPKNAPIRNNLAAALCKVMDFNGAKREIEVALDLDPKYVKAWARKGDIEVLMKENHKAMDSYKKGLAIDPANATCKEGLRKVTSMINYGSANMTEEERKERAAHAMADPEIQAILQDPVINQILRDFQENPNAANQAMMDPTVRGKIEKLVASGILQTG